MKVAVVHNRYRSAAPSGEDGVVDAESAALRAAGHTVVPFERRSDDMDSWPVWRKAALPATSIRSPGTGRDLSALLAKERPDVVHVHNTFPLMSASVLQSAAAARVPIVVTLHNSRVSCARGDFLRDGESCRDCVGRAGLPALAHRCYRDSVLATTPVVIGILANRRVWAHRPSAYIFVSDFHRRSMAHEGFPPDRCFVKWNLVARPPKVDAPDDGRIVYLGRLDVPKGTLLLMDAWERFRRLRPNQKVRLAIGGSGPLTDSVRAWAAERCDVDVVGFLDRSQSTQLLAGAVAVVAPSVVRETFGLVAVESLSVGTPVIVAGHGGLAELIEDGTTGAHFTPGDPDALARAFIDVVDRPAFWKDLRSACRARYEQRFDPDVNLGQLLGIYEFAIRNPVDSLRNGGAAVSRTAGAT